MPQRGSVPTPNEADPSGSTYAFEKGVSKAGGGDGFADVWKQDHFAWEYKGKRKDLVAAYQQLLLYRETLENPPLLVVSDLDRFEVHTNFTATPVRVHSFTLADLLDRPAEPLRVLRAVMERPEELRPGTTREEITAQAAERFASLAERLRARGYGPQEVAHFLDKILFCFFAEDAGLLPDRITLRLANASVDDPNVFSHGLAELFGRMANGGGFFGAERIQWFNGGLFDDDTVLPLTPEEISLVGSVSRLEWAAVEPAISAHSSSEAWTPASVHNSALTTPTVTQSCGLSSRCSSHHSVGTSRTPKNESPTSWPRIGRSPRRHQPARTPRTSSTASWTNSGPSGCSTLRAGLETSCILPFSA